MSADQLAILEACLASTKRAHRYLVIAVTILVVGMLATIVTLGVQAYVQHERYQRASSERAELHREIQMLRNQDCVSTEAPRPSP